MTELAESRVREAIMAQLRPHLDAAKIGDSTLADDSSLLQLGVVDSFQLVNVIVGLQDALGIEIDFMDASPDDFASIAGLIRIAMAR